MIDPFAAAVGFVFPVIAFDATPEVLADLLMLDCCRTLKPSSE